MAQFKIYGHRGHLTEIQAPLSDIIHAAAIQALGVPADKRFHRFFPLEPENFVHPPDRSGKYLVLEISMCAGRTDETRKALLKLLMAEISKGLDIPINDIEITITETPRENWGIRGQTGDELVLNYKVET